MRLEHIGIAVKDTTEGTAVFSKILGHAPYKTEEVQSEGVLTTFFKAGETKIELLSATHPESPIAKFLLKKGPGLHHIAFEVNDIAAEMERLKGEGFEFTAEAPRMGADHKLICFLHPKTSQGVLIELCQDTSITS